jgi:hypothetical protein
MSEMVAPGTSYHDPQEGQRSERVSACPDEPVSEYGCYPYLPAGAWPFPHPLTLSDLHERYPDLVPWFWVGGLDPREWWYCVDCKRCTPSPRLTVGQAFHKSTGLPPPGRLCDYAFGYYDPWVGCPHCDSRELYRWSGWPSRVLGLSSDPDPEQEYPLPDYITAEEEPSEEEPDQP